MATKLQAIDDRLPAYVRLRDTLASRIASGDWTARQPIPSEARLAREFGVSVGTVRKGVDGLVQEGLLERRQGSGTFVRAPSFDATLFRFFQLREANGTQLPIPTSKLVLRSKCTAPGEAAQALLGGGQRRARGRSVRPAVAALRRRQKTRCPTRAASSRPSRRPASRRCPRPTTSRASSRRRRRPRPSSRPRRRRGRCRCCSVRVRNTHCILTTATSPSARRRAGAQTSRGGSPPPRHPKPPRPCA